MATEFAPPLPLQPKHKVRVNGFMQVAVPQSINLHEPIHTIVEGGGERLQSINNFKLKMAARANKKMPAFVRPVNGQAGGTPQVAGGGEDAQLASRIGARKGPKWNRSITLVAPTASSCADADGPKQLEVGFKRRELPFKGAGAVPTNADLAAQVTSRVSKPNTGGHGDFVGKERLEKHMLFYHQVCRSFQPAR
jgi:hypothetical protein